MADTYTRCQKFLPPPLTLALSPRWGERGEEERTFGKRYRSAPTEKLPFDCDLVLQAVNLQFPLSSWADRRLDRKKATGVPLGGYSGFAARDVLPEV